MSQDRPPLSPFRRGQKCDSWQRSRASQSLRLRGERRYRQPPVVQQLLRRHYQQHQPLPFFPPPGSASDRQRLSQPAGRRTRCAVARQRIWYAFRRAGLTFAYPTRTLVVERKARAGAADSDGGAIVERLAAVDIFAPLSVEETAMLATAATSHIFAPGETVIRAGDPGSSMFVVHNGRVSVQVSENGRARTVATLSEGAFFGEMALF